MAMKRTIVSILALLIGTSVSNAQQASIGIAASTLSEKAYIFDTAEQHRIRVSVVVKGLNHPFAVALLPSGDALVSERGGGLRLVRNAAETNGKVAELLPDAIGGIPILESTYRNVGLHDVVLHPQFARNQFVYFTFNKPGNPPAADATQPIRRESVVSLWRGKFTGKTLTQVEELFTGESGSTSGSRIAFGKDGFIYMTTGGPFGDTAQQLSNVYGKVLRLTNDGKIPVDNPFAGQANKRGEIYSYGHRDALGLTVDPVSGAVLEAEHGPNGGDEVNLILPGRNYGWPKVSFGRDYTGPRISPSPVMEGVEQPLILWLPSIAPTGLTFYNGDKFPTWKNNLFVGSARRGEVNSTGSLERVVFNDKLEEIRREALLSDFHQRIRDVRQGPDGLLYVVTDEGDGALLRIEPTT
jgi:aldose sugar dehydrogenase